VFNTPSFRMGRLFGIPIEVNVTWLAIFVLVTASLSFSYFPSAFPDWALGVSLTAGVITALLFFASIVFHEMSHSLVARAGGIKVDKVTLFLFGGVAQMEEDPSTPGREFLMAIAGPAASIFLAAVFASAAVVMHRAGISDYWWGPAEYLGIINVAIALFNMLPGFPLDGGRVLRALLWKIKGDKLWATRWASNSGQVIGYGLVAFAVFGVLQGALNMLWMGLVGWFIVVLADTAYRQQLARSTLNRQNVGSLASTDVMVVPGDITVERLVFDYFVDGPHTRYPVVVDGAVVGLVTLDAAKATPREEWSRINVEEITAKDLSVLLVDADEHADKLLDRLGRGTSSALIVKRDGHLAGIVTRADIIAYLHRTGVDL